jgi:hypothetical protein
VLTIHWRKKQAKQETITQRTFSTDYISNLITSNNISSYEKFQRTLPTETKIQLLKQLGYVGQNIIKTLIKIHTTEKLQTIKSQHYYQLILNNFDIQHRTPQNVTWLNKLFSSNNISIENRMSAACIYTAETFCAETVCIFVDRRSKLGNIFLGISVTIFTDFKICMLCPKALWTGKCNFMSKFLKYG